MSLFVIADLHLSLNGEKPMDVFRGWQNYVQRLEEHWRDQVQQEDTVVIAGDISWAMRLEDVYKRQLRNLSRLRSPSFPSVTLSAWT